MTTRWFVEVSPVDADTLKERYCVEAIQWQQALQQARKIRGDRGPLSRFSIELLDVGYRATDPSSKIRYTVSKAPGDAPLTAALGSNGAERPQSAAANARASTRPAAPVAVVPSGGAPAAASGAPTGSGPAQVAAAAAPARVAKPQAPQEPVASARAPQKPSISKVPAQRASADPAPPRPSARIAKAAGDHVPVPTAVVSVRSAVVAEEGATPAEAIPLVNMTAPKPAPVEQPEPAPVEHAQEPVVPLAAAPAPEPEAAQPEPVPSLPGLELIAVRREEPREGIPIVYREFAFAIAAGVSARELERYARAAWEQARSALAQRPQGKFIQIAIFDHKFSGRPERPPLAVLAWKDWRGDPVIQIHGADAAAAQRAASQPAAHPAPVVQPAAPVVQPAAPVAQPAAPVVQPAAPVAQPAAPVAQPAAPVAQPAAPVAQPAPVIQPSAVGDPPGAGFVDPAAAVQAQAVLQPPATVIQAPAFVQAAAPVAATAPTAPDLAQSFPQAGTVGAAPPEPAPDAAAPPLAHALKPMARAAPAAAPRRRGPNEDLISDLFEEMHQLHFMPDLVAGAEYVASVLFNVLPCEGSIVHVFDINTRQFVVVRATGPKSPDVLLHRTPDTFAHFRDAFRRGRALAFTPEPGDERVQRELWDRLGVQVQTGLCGAVQQAGRYLGIIELANPLGGAPFHVGELNAFDYICEQFADFVAQRPIVLDADAVIPRH